MLVILQSLNTNLIVPHMFNMAAPPKQMFTV